MYEDGYQTITNIDISRVVVDQMIDRYTHARTRMLMLMLMLMLTNTHTSKDAPTRARTNAYRHT